MLQVEHSAILSIFIKVPFVVKTFVMSIFECPFYTGFTVLLIVPVDGAVLFYILDHTFLSHKALKISLSQLSFV